MKRLFFYASMLLMTASFAACSDDENDGPKGNVDCHDVMDAEAINRMNYETVCMRLLEMKVDGTDTSYVVANAEQSDPVNRNVYSYDVKSVEEAEKYFRQFCVPSDSDFVVRTEGVKKIVDFGKYGTIVYDGTQSGETFATITANLAYLNAPATIYLESSDGNASTPYEIGDIIKYEGKVWLCTVEYGGGTKQLGRLMRFGNDKTYTVSDHWKTAYLAKDCADAVAADGFIELMKTRALRDAIIKQFLDNNYGNANKKVMQYLNNDWRTDGLIFMISERHYDEWCWSCWRYPQNLWIHYFYIYSGNVHYGDYYCYHEIGKIQGCDQPFKNKMQTEQKTFGSSELSGAVRLWPKY